MEPDRSHLALVHLLRAATGADHALLTWVPLPLRRGVRPEEPKVFSTARRLGTPRECATCTRRRLAHALDDVDPGLDGRTLADVLHAHAGEGRHDCPLGIRQLAVLPVAAGGERIALLAVASCGPGERPIDDRPLARLRGAARLLARQLDLEREREALRARLDGVRTTLGGLVQTLTSAVETRDPYTALHQRRVADLARSIGTAMGFSDTSVETLRVAGTVHDIGKISVPGALLNRPGVLSELEFALIKTHPVSGHRILHRIQFDGPVADVVRQHHERLDGSGYPDGLAGDEILPEARVLAVADVVEAMASHRPYRPALGVDAALDELRAGRGERYDAAVVDATIGLFEIGGYAFA